MSRPSTVGVLVLLLCAGCVGSGDTVTVVDTDADTWTVEVETLWTTGWQDMDVLVTTGSGAPACDLGVIADVTMPSMGHGSDLPVTVDLLGEGVYRVRAHFQMEGPWQLEATFDDGELSDRVAVDLDVVGG